MNIIQNLIQKEVRDGCKTTVLFVNVYSESESELDATRHKV